MEKNNQNVLPQISDVKAIHYQYFPTIWQMIVWRNWGYVPVERIAQALNTVSENIRIAAKQMGLNPYEPVNEEWKRRGYLTIIRDNWHICTYEQILILLDMTAEELAFILKEDDFMWVKLGKMKPNVNPVEYKVLTDEEITLTERIAKVCKEYKGTDNGFQFIQEYQRPLAEEELQVACRNESEQKRALRFVYPYFALYGDALLDESIDPFPDRLLRDYANVGINGIWMQGVLYQLIEFPFKPSLSKGWQKRIQSLNRLVKRAKRFGIGVYLYLNEPRAMADAFFQEYPNLRGNREGEFYAMCTSTSEVQNYLYQSMKQLFALVPDLAGYFTITMSENLTNCYSRMPEGMQCARCKERNPWEVVAEVNNLMAKGAHESAPNAKAIVWTWGWPNSWCEKVVPLLTENQILQCTSEEGMPFCIGGIEGSVIDYTMSLCGPGEKARSMWNVATQHRLEKSAKVQINNTWELAAVPYIPVFEKVETHIHNLKKQGIQHLQASWTLGGSPSPNLSLAAWLMEEKGTLLDFLHDWLGEEQGDVVYVAQKQFSQAFSHFPFHIDTLYYGPQNFGPMAPFFLEKTGYQASMIGFPYDDMERWRGIYPVAVFEKEVKQLCDEWREGLHILSTYEGKSKELDDLIFWAKVIQCHFDSTYHHIRFVTLRDGLDEPTGKEAEEMLSVIRKEKNVVESLIQLRHVDSRVGYESSNHYFYTLQDLKEKIINLNDCEEMIGEKTI